MKFGFKHYSEDDEGAVTVDWVVLTAALISLTLSLFAALSVSTVDHGSEIVERVDIETNF